MKIVRDKNLKAEFNEIRRTAYYQIERIKLEVTESLVQVMETRGISNAELADRLGTSRAYITKLLQGDVNFTLETLVRQSQALEASFIPPAFEVRGARKTSKKSRPRVNTTSLRIQKG